MIERERSPDYDVEKITHADRGSEIKDAEKLDIDVEQIQRADR